MPAKYQILNKAELFESKLEFFVGALGGLQSFLKTVMPLRK